MCHLPSILSLRSCQTLRTTDPSGRVEPQDQRWFDRGASNFLKRSERLIDSILVALLKMSVDLPGKLKLTVG